ncbi:MAG TPA: hypothetical protein VFH56_05450 [Acidimicrobiales bacterium]|nr:hypothetical protein [Acidimicrobiales bacterium]
MTPQERLTWAHERLDTYLRECRQRDYFDALDELRDAVEHVTECDGKDRTCIDMADTCTGGDDCKTCETDCQDCAYYRKGHAYGGKVWTRPMLELVDLLEDVPA